MNRKRSKHAEDYIDEDNEEHCVPYDASKEAKLDDIVHDFGGEEAIRLCGKNTPIHVLRAYKELCFFKQQRGDVINSGGLINDEEEIDLNTIKLINNECFNFIQCLLSKWN